MLWDLVRDFFVQYVFGGYASDATQYQNIIGFVDWGGDFDEAYNTDFLLNFGSIRIGIGDYLSTLATIITMIIIVVCCAKLVLYIFNTMRRIIS